MICQNCKKRERTGYCPEIKEYTKRKQVACEGLVPKPKQEAEKKS